MRRRLPAGGGRSRLARPRPHRPPLAADGRAGNHHVWRRRRLLGRHEVLPGRLDPHGRRRLRHHRLLRLSQVGQPAAAAEGPASPTAVWSIRASRQRCCRGDDKGDDNSLHGANGISGLVVGIVISLLRGLGRR